MYDKIIPVTTDVIFFLNFGEGEDVGHGILRKPCRLLKSIQVGNGRDRQTPTVTLQLQLPPSLPNLTHTGLQKNLYL
jgi:hypothetical protein